MSFQRNEKGKKKVSATREQQIAALRRKIEAKLSDSNPFRRQPFTTFQTEAGETLVPSSSCYRDESPLIYSSPEQCLNDLPRSYPPSCLNGSADLTYFGNGAFSADQTFYKCLANIDQTSIPTAYDGKYNGCSFLKTYITLLNLVEVRYPKDNPKINPFIINSCVYSR